MQATLTLPGMAALALTVGMAIDANVLINERIRDELRAGISPQLAIHAGYERAFGTIIDSNITTLIAGIALFAFGSGPVKGFAVVLCLGILTSVFTATFVSRGLVNLIYGSRRRLDHVPIGKIWIPEHGAVNSKTLPHDEDEAVEVAAGTRIKEHRKASIQSEALDQTAVPVEANHMITEAKTKPSDQAVTKTQSKRKTSAAKQTKK
jgi:preprotein translocase subunit SecD